MTFPFTQVIVRILETCAGFTGEVDGLTGAAVLSKVSFQSSPYLVFTNDVEFMLSSERYATTEGEE